MQRFDLAGGAKVWLFRGIKKGVLTTRYPEEVSKEEAEMLEVQSCTVDKCPMGMDFCVSCWAGERKKARITVRRKLPFRKSVHVFFADIGSCNACNREVEMLNNPYYDFHRLGIFFTPTPRHADVLLVSGSSKSMVEPLKRAYLAMPEPKVVVAIGSCTVNFFKTLEESGEMKADVLVPGCPPSPLLILKSLLLVRGEKVERTEEVP